MSDDEWRHTSRIATSEKLIKLDLATDCGVVAPTAMGKDVVPGHNATQMV